MVMFSFISLPMHINSQIMPNTKRRLSLTANFDEYRNLAFSSYAIKVYRDMYRIVTQESRYVSYPEVTVSLQP